MQKIILLMTSNGEGCHYLVMGKLSALLRGITSKHDGNFYCLNCLHSLRTKTSLNHIKEYVKIKLFVLL